MNYNDYLERVKNQQKWYSKKSSLNKRYFLISSILKLILIASIPLISLKEYNNFIYPYLIPIISFFTIIIEGIQEIFKFKENWTTYRNASELLKRELSLYKTNSGTYKEMPESNCYNLFVEQCENIISNENNLWIERVSKIDSKSK